MAKKKNSFLQVNFQQSYASFILGAIVVVILGLLVANFFTHRSSQIDNGVQTTQTPEQVVQESGGSYKVAADDSLSKISEKYYGTMDYWPELAKVNKISNPNIIYVDTNLQMPSKSSLDAMKVEMTQTSYQVKEGDTLFIIAEKMYGDGSQWTRIDTANKVGRLPNGNPLIFAGNNLVIPR